MNLHVKYIYYVIYLNLFFLLSMSCVHHTTKILNSNYLPNEIKKTTKDLSYIDLIDKKTNNFSQNITEQQFLKDKSILIYALEKAYIGKIIHPNNLWRRVIQEILDLPFENDSFFFCKKISKILSRYPDKHIQVFHRKNDTPCPKKNIGIVNSNLNNTSLNWDGKKIGDTFFISIKFMPFGEWDGFIDFVKEAKNSSKNIVIDMRNNTGGSTEMGLKMARVLLASKLSTNFSKAIVRKSSESITIYKNQMIEYLPRQYKKKRINELNQEIKRSLKGEISEYLHFKDLDKNINILHDSKPYEGNIYLLQNKLCISSCEFVIDFLSFHPNLKKVGTNTAGAIHFTESGYLRLPYSGIKIYLPTRYTEFRDKKNREYIGISPDIIVKEGDNAMYYVMKKIINTM